MKLKIFSSLLAVLLLNVCVSKTNAQDNKVYDHVSLKNPPTYPGGIQKFYEFFGSNLKYPKSAVENNIQGTVYITFVIEKDGSLTGIKPEGRKLGYGIENEAIRVLTLAKKWNPGMVASKPIRTQFNLPLKFTIPNKKPNVKTATATAKATPARVEPNTVYDQVAMETPPTYPGGIAALYKFLSSNMVYPKAAAEAKVKGTTYVTFTIEKDGSLTDIKAEGRKLGSGLDEEAIRVVKLSKKWNPGLINGMPVRVKYNIPVKFTM
ncbi:energy transducer TonB [Pedobacter sp. Du54]|uniref:energy transducer TonB n=1 Tax=Pedobacter anseongensis TaxID=3133439 RepID=UPI0030B39358